MAPKTNTKAKNNFTFSQATEGFFLNATARGLSDATLRDYGNTIKRFSEFLGEDLPISGITTQHIERFLSSQGHLSNKTLLNYHTGLSAFWTWATKEELVEKHIVRAIIAPKPEKREIVPFSENEIKLMLGSLEKSRAYTRPGKKLSDHAVLGAERSRAILLLLLDTGMRASELCNLDIQHLDIRAQRVLVMGKGSKERMLPFSARTGQVLWRYLATRPGAEKTEPLFTTLDGRFRMDRDDLRRRLSIIAGRAKVEGVHPHRFRHTFAIQFLRNGGDPYTLQVLLGHSTMEMVRRYLAIAQTDLERAHKRASPVDNWRL